MSRLTGEAPYSAWDNVLTIQDHIEPPSPAYSPIHRASTSRGISKTTPVRRVCPYQRAANQMMEIVDELNGKVKTAAGLLRKASELQPVNQYRSMEEKIKGLTIHINDMDERLRNFMLKIESLLEEDVKSEK